MTTGICKIILPLDMNYRFSENSFSNTTDITLPVKIQKPALSKSSPYSSAQIYAKGRKPISLKKLKVRDNLLKRKWNYSNDQTIEDIYWKKWLTSKDAHTLYCSDVDAKYFRSYNDRGAGDSWDIRSFANNKNSLLKYFSRFCMEGINQSMIYCAIRFSTFTWHVEDNFLHSLSYHHHGEPRTWYGIPGTERVKVEHLAKE